MPDSNQLSLARSAIPESKLAREAELAYCMICMSTDYDCWSLTPYPSFLKTAC